jgi:hypothetical protein
MRFGHGARNMEPTDHRGTNRPSDRSRSLALTLPVAERRLLARAGHTPAEIEFLDALRAIRRLCANDPTVKDQHRETGTGCVR